MSKHSSHRSMGPLQPHFATTTEVSNFVNLWGIFTVNGQQIVAFVKSVDPANKSMLVLYPNGTQSYIDVTQISQAQGPYPSMPSIPGQSSGQGGHQGGGSQWWPQHGQGGGQGGGSQWPPHGQGGGQGGGSQWWPQHGQGGGQGGGSQWWPQHGQGGGSQWPSGGSRSANRKNRKN
ncbi:MULTISPECIES: hypothetical protein [Paenibacillus]|uniref:Uncharacterized protein n=2 Tax=Paenibacillus TaxID=44249 RepID=A0ABX2ZC74_PAEPO|nr:MULTISPECIES: hypothetical protein [Paenibacillus]MDR6781010.1 hypothetical protein [Paenibacillus peoriae]ODA07581.1 hypothetical protein A7312_10920 [Paenibacillus polymyxa]